MEKRKKGKNILTDKNNNINFKLYVITLKVTKHHRAHLLIFWGISNE